MTDLAAANAVIRANVSRSPLRRVFFQHLMKTGGTSVVAMLENYFPNNAVCEYGRIRGDYAKIYIQASRATFVHDHSYILHLRTPGSFSFTFLREPFSRLLSARRQWTDAAEVDIKQMNAPSATAVVALRALDLDRILDLVFDYPVTVPWFWNHQAVTLGLRKLERSVFQNRNPKRLYSFFPYAKSYRTWLKQNRDNILREALTTLRSLDYVGIFEDFDDSVREVFTRIGLPEPETTLHLNPRAPYKDEQAENLRKKAAPFLDLDYEVYEEACELRARAGRAARGAPADFIGRAITPAEDKDFGAEQAPGGHGWYPATQRGDGAYSRWTGPGCVSTFRLRMAPGDYRLEVWLLGAVSEAAIEGLKLLIDGFPVPVSVQATDAGYYVSISSIRRVHGGMVEIAIVAGETIRNYGLEFECIHIVGSDSPSFSLLPHRWHDRAHGRPEPVAFNAEGRRVSAKGQAVFSMEEETGGEGWRRANFRQDGSFSRWTGPGETSTFPLYMEAGAYRVELRVCGAVSPSVLMGIMLKIDDGELPVSITTTDSGRFLAIAETRINQEGERELVITVPETLKGYGIEVESISFAGIT